MGNKMCVYGEGLGCAYHYPRIYAKLNTLCAGGVSERGMVAAEIIVKPKNK